VTDMAQSRCKRSDRKSVSGHCRPIIIIIIMKSYTKYTNEKYVKNKKENIIIMSQWLKIDL